MNNYLFEKKYKCKSDKDKDADTVTLFPSKFPNDKEICIPFLLS